MKKIFITFSLIFIGLALIPIIGNSLVKQTLESSIYNLKEKGIEVQNVFENAEYLTTSRHYEFVLKDVDKFINYFNKHSDKQLPVYTKEFLKNTVLATDLKYSNIPFEKEISLDIYPLSLSDEIMKSLEGKDKKFAQSIQSFLINKGLLYHLDYDVLNEEFSGYVKDIDENHTLQNNSRILLKVSNLTYKGTGNFATPNTLQTKFDEVVVKILDENKEMSIDSKNFSSNFFFKSKNRYNSSANVKFLEINIDDNINESIFVSSSNLDVNISCDEDFTKAKYSSKISSTGFTVKSDKLDLNATMLNYHAKFSDVDKASKKKLQELISRLDVNYSLEDLLNAQDGFLSLLSKGLKLNLVDFSVENINIDGENLKGFSLDSKLLVKKDKDLSNKVKYFPLFLVNSADFDLNFILSRKIFNKILDSEPLLIFTQFYVKKSGDDLKLNVVLKDSRLSINGKKLL